MPRKLTPPTTLTTEKTASTTTSTTVEVSCTCNKMRFLGDDGFFRGACLRKDQCEDYFCYVDSNSDCPDKEQVKNTDYYTSFAFLFTIQIDHIFTVITCIISIYTDD